MSSKFLIRGGRSPRKRTLSVEVDLYFVEKDIPGMAFDHILDRSPSDSKIYRLDWKTLFLLPGQCAHQGSGDCLKTPFVDQIHQEN